MTTATKVVVVGAGLAGLSAAAYLGRAGQRAVVLEKAGAPGGRAATQEKSGFSLNLGAHALYRGGAATRVLDELGVRYQGAAPPVSGGFAFDRGRLHTLPGGLLSLLSTGLCGLAGKLEIARLLGGFAAIDPAPLQRVPVAAWIAQQVHAPEAQRLVSGLVRLSTYASDLERMSAGAAIAQVQHALRDGVLYLDGGWRTLIDGLREKAVEAGVELRTEARAAAVELTGGAVSGVRLADGSLIPASAVILAASPRAASALLPGVPALTAMRERALPVEAACLDVALSSLPRKAGLFALGLDRPLYLSVHSASARLAPEGGALVHLMKYGPSGDAAADEAELAALLDLVQPGWQARVVERRFLPAMIAANALVSAEEGGLAGRPGPVVPGVEGLFLAGDWVGAEGMLAEASLASGKRAADLCAAAAREQARPPLAATAQA